MMPTADWLEPSSAHSLAQKIEAYWLARGYGVRTEIEESVRAKDNGKPIFCVRSDMHNGLPARRATPMEQAA